MKKLFALLLAFAMLLTMTACGGAAEPAETAAPTASAESPTEAPTEAPTEPAVIYARYKVSEDPNFDPDAGHTNPYFVDLPMVLAITYDDEIVYWIHLGSSTFHKTTDGFVRYVNGARY